MSYMDRALRAKSPRYARILEKLGYQRSDMAVEDTAREANLDAPPAHDPLDHDGDGRKGGSIAAEPADGLIALRAEYTALVGRRPFMGWDADVLRQKIAEAKG